MAKGKNSCSLAGISATKAIKSRVAEMRKHTAAAAAHNADGIHDLRVASRRLRAALASHAAQFDKKALKKIQRRVRQITRRLGKARELDVTIGSLAKRRSKLEGTALDAASFVLRRLRELRREESEKVDKAVASVRSAKFRNALANLLESQRPAKICYVKSAARTLREEFDELVSQYDAWRLSPSDDALHIVRIDFKKFRYHCEIFADLYPKSMPGFIDRLKAAQESLGLWNDCRVLRDYVVSLTQDGPGASLKGAARLTNQIHEDVAKLLEAFDKTAIAFFAVEQRNELRHLLDGPTKSCCNPAFAADDGKRNRLASKRKKN